VKGIEEITDKFICLIKKTLNPIAIMMINLNKPCPIIKETTISQEEDILNLGTKSFVKATTLPSTLPTFTPNIRACA